ncbi:unnamed protein product [Boreogadus saida]
MSDSILILFPINCSFICIFQSFDPTDFHINRIFMICQMNVKYSVAMSMHHVS